MKPEILEKLTWRNVQDIVDVADKMRKAFFLANNTPLAWYEPEVFYTEVLNRLKEKNR